MSEAQLRELAVEWIDRMGPEGARSFNFPEPYLFLKTRSGARLVARVRHIAAFAIRYGYITDDPMVSAAADAPDGVSTEEMLRRIEVAESVYNRQP